ncbi:hypothetical protein HPB52_023580 [Rhipicephalus sanguineus]|uniref:Uncharacterized protein n=1 Tax=Rhipicephalus sanguineus TaxID=34632 RepID=A0A9D4TC66_RHISA|nr:hypothetical protein HPB52_023580 [Rhipicephalus sanguineus]
MKVCTCSSKLFTFPEVSYTSPLPVRTSFSLTFSTGAVGAWHVCLRVLSAALVGDNQQGEDADAPESSSEDREALELGFERVGFRAESHDSAIGRSQWAIAKARRPKHPRTGRSGLVTSGGNLAVKSTKSPSLGVNTGSITTKFSMRITCAVCGDASLA